MPMNTVILALLCILISSSSFHAQVYPNDHECQDDFNYMKQVCPAIYEVEHVKGPIQNHTHCPSVICTFSVFHYNRPEEAPPTVCILHWDRKCTILEDGTDTCCPGSGGGDPELPWSSEMTSWGDWEHMPDGSKTMQVGYDRILIRVENDTFSNPDADVIYQDLPDAVTDFPKIQSRDYTPTNAVVVEEIPTKPIHMTIPKMGRYLSWRQECSNGTSNTLTALLFRYDPFHMRWVTLPGQSISDDALDATFPPELFKPSRQVFISMLRMEKEYVKSYPSIMYAVPEAGFKERWHWVPYERGECVIPVPMDDDYGKIQDAAKRMGFKVLGNPSVKRWARWVLFIPTIDYILSKLNKSCQSVCARSLCFFFDLTNLHAHVMQHHLGWHTLLL